MELQRNEPPTQVRDAIYGNRQWQTVSQEAISAAIAVYTSDIPQGIAAQFRALIFANIIVKILEPLPTAETSTLTPAKRARVNEGARSDAEPSNSLQTSGKAHNFRPVSEEFLQFFEDTWVRGFLAEFVDTWHVLGIVPIIFDKDERNRPFPRVAQGWETGQLMLEIGLDRFRRRIRITSGHSMVNSGPFSVRNGDDDENARALKKVWIAYAPESVPLATGALNSTASRLWEYWRHYHTSLQTATALEAARRIPTLVMMNKLGKSMDELLAEGFPDIVDDDAIDKFRQQREISHARQANQGMTAALNAANTNANALGWRSIITSSNLEFQQQLHAEPGVTTQFDLVAKQFWHLTQALMGMPRIYERRVGMQSKVEGDDSDELAKFTRALFLQRFETLLRKLYAVRFGVDGVKITLSYSERKM